MKNFAKLMVLVVVVAMSVAVLAGCAPSDYTKAEANLKDAGYTVTVVENGDVLNLANAGAKVIAAAYDVTLTGSCTQIVNAVKDEEGVSIYYFDNSEDAAALKKALAASIKEDKEELKASLDKGDITQEDYDKAIEDMKDAAYGAFGKVFWFGTKDAASAM